MLWFWLILAAAMLVLEMATTALVSIWFTAGALGAAVLAAAGLPVWSQLVVFALISGLLFFTCRDWLVRHFRHTRIQTGPETVIHEIGIVTVPIDPIEGGRILVNGQDWKAISLDHEAIAKDRKVKVAGIQGVKLEVYAVPEDAVLHVPMPG